MASITSLSNSNYNTSSIYGNRNVLSGLASGMDTEQMIENAVSGIKMKIQNLIKKRTKVEWQQEAYRSIIDKAVNFSNKYASYTSKTNLLSQSFFNNAVTTATQGTYKDKVTASGKTSSDIKLNGVKQLATAASYTVSGLGGKFSGEMGSVTSTKSFDMDETMQVSNVSGTLTFQYGGTNGTTFDITLDDLQDWNEMEGRTNAEKLASAINKKLSEITYSYTKNGVNETTTADKVVKVEGIGGKISFSDGLGNGNKVAIVSSSGNIKNAFDLTEDEYRDLSVGSISLTKPVPTSTYLANKNLTMTLNGVTKTINMSKVVNKSAGTGDSQNVNFQIALQEELDNAFGAGKIDVKRSQDGKLSFTPSGEGSTLSLGGTAAEALGFSAGDANYVNTTKKLSDLLGDDIFKDANKLRGEGAPRLSSNGKYYVDDEGNRVNKDGIRIDSDGKELYTFRINDADIKVTKDMTLEGLMSSINSNADAGVKVSYSQVTNEFKFTATETGTAGKIKFGGLAEDMFVVPNSKGGKFAATYGVDIADGDKQPFTFNFGSSSVTLHNVTNASSIEDVAKQLNATISNKGWTASYDTLSGQLVVTDKTGKNIDFSMSVNGEKLEPKFASSYVTGQDAVMDVEINGKRFENLTRSSNSFNIDGLTINVKGTFNEDGSAVDKDGNDITPVTFETTTDSDKIIEAIRDFVNDYNEMVTELKSAYTTMPAEKANKERYEPLTAEQEEQYTESELKAYNEKAKQGILFADSTLSSMYSKLLNAIQPGGTDGQTLREIGISTSYSSGLTTISLDEDKLRNALDSDPDKVKNAFTKTQEGGSSSNGLMQTLQNTLNTYTKTTGEPKGVLIQRAGSVKAPTSLNNNSLKSQIDSLDNQITRWQNKMSDQIDRYTTQFTRLEQLIAEMNSQASAMSGLMGGYGGY